VNKLPPIAAAVAAVLMLGLMHDSQATGGNLVARNPLIVARDTQSPTEELALRVTKLEQALAQQQVDYQAKIDELQQQINDRSTHEDSLKWAIVAKHDLQALDTKFVCHQHTLQADNHTTTLESAMKDCKYWDGTWHN
jgi:hypothetical protein